MIFLGLLIIAIGAFCQSSSYVPINKVKDWSWESYWIIQGVFAWLVFPLMGALLAVPAGENLFALYAANPAATFKTIFFGIICLWVAGENNYPRITVPVFQNLRLFVFHI